MIIQQFLDLLWISCSHTWRATARTIAWVWRSPCTLRIQWYISSLKLHKIQMFPAYNPSSLTWHLSLYWEYNSLNVQYNSLNDHVASWESQLIWRVLNWEKVGMSWQDNLWCLLTRTFSHIKTHRNCHLQILKKNNPLLTVVLYSKNKEAVHKICN